MLQTSALVSSSSNSFDEFSRNFRELFDTLQHSKNNLATGPVDSVLARALAALSEANNIISEQSSRINTLENLVVTDELTGLLNRRGFSLEMEKEMQRVARGVSCGGIFAALDLDNFKQVNDQHGHPAGDACLMTVSSYFQKTIRSTDIVCRTGGDEFILVLTNIDEAMGARRVQQIIEGLGQESCNWQECLLPINASYGFVHYGKGNRIEDLIQESDQSLYDMKKLRKNGAHERQIA